MYKNKVKIVTFILFAILSISYSSSATEDKQILGILKKYKESYQDEQAEGFKLEEKDRKLLLSKSKQDFDWESKAFGDYQIDHVDIELLFNLKFHVSTDPLYSNIVSLNLAGNNLYDKGTMELFKGMPLFTALVKLNIGRNKITDASIKTLQNQLKNIILLISGVL